VQGRVTVVSSVNPHFLLVLIQGTETLAVKNPAKREALSVLEVLIVVVVVAHMALKKRDEYLQQKPAHSGDDSSRPGSGPSPWREHGLFCVAPARPSVSILSSFSLRYISGEQFSFVLLCQNQPLGLKLF